ncbi:juvenile hormone esterase-like [Schistocerca gregaria]|uniref:juvenile hormone esterase-like n=1 Tax=Schistocerca gregaria TaxID=7010 RepID=UPI00211ECBCF|nr:juvenile hormone esterase-like [Schistocerca gregaria]
MIAFPTLLVAAVVACVTAQNVTVQTTAGLLRGVSTTTINGTAYYRFSGVPFAAPPVGELRFKPPQPVAQWEGVRDALEEAEDCLQAMGPQMSGSEDCLYLNLYTPSLSEEALLPVMVWIFGGHFWAGSSSAREYGPDFLLDQGVIVVALNYRLGVMGLLSLNDSIAMGNNAFKDMVAALQWVQDNVRAFGGDPEKVTIFGQSAGGISCEMLMYSPLARGLFRAVISQSGSALGGDHIVDTNREMAFCIGNELGFQTEDAEELLAFLQTADAEALYQTSCGTEFQITAEPDVEGAFMTADHSRLGAWAIAGNFTHLPLLTGVTTGEGKLGVSEGYIPDSTLAELNSDFEGAIDNILRLGDMDEKLAVADAVRLFYFGNVTTISADAAIPYSEMTTDLNNGEPCDTTVHILSTTMEQPVFYYQYAYTGRSDPSVVPGAPHMADLDSLFSVPGSGQNLDPASDEQKVRSAMVKLWTNFAKYMNPTPDEDPVIEGGWPRFNESTAYYLNIDVNITLEQNRNAERMNFVHSVIPPYY